MSQTIPSLFIMLTIVPSLAITTVFCVAPFLKRQSAALRHFLWLLAIGTSVAVVAIFPTGFQLVLPLLPPKPVLTEKSIPVSASPNSDRAVDFVKDTDLDITQRPVHTREGSVLSSTVAPQAQAFVSLTSSASTASHPWKISSLFWLGWFFGLTFMLLKLAIDQVRIQSLLRSCSAAPEALTFLANTIQGRLGLKRSPIILVAGPNQIPLCCGLFRPVIVVPEEGDFSKQSIYIHHEMAHLVRHDLVWLFVGQLSCAISWFNPLVWRAFQNLSMEGEMAADDLVLKHGIGSVDYAKNLVELVEMFKMNLASGSVALAMAQPRSLSRRIKRILNDSIARHSPGKALLASITLVASTAVFTALCVRVVEGQTPTATPSPAATGNSTPAPAADDADSSPEDKEEQRILRLADEGGQLKDEEVSSLEKKVAATPGDVDDRVRLIGYYAAGDDMDDKESTLAQPHILWLINNVPGSPAAGDRVMPSILEPKYGKEVEAAWLSALDRNPNSPGVIKNAVDFFGFSEKNDRIEALLKKGEALEPSNSYWPEMLGVYYSHTGQNLDSLKKYEEAVAKSTKKLDRIRLLQEVCAAALKVPDYDQAEKYANELIHTIPTHVSRAEISKDYSEAIYSGNTTLGEVLLSKGDVASAKRYLLASAETPGDALLNALGYDLTLAKQLLAKGEKDAVIEFLNKMAAIWKKQADRIPGWITEIQHGHTPVFQLTDETLTSETAAELEKEVEANPDDLDDRVRLIEFYRHISVSSQNGNLQKLENHMLWIINNAPDTECADDPMITVSTDRLLPLGRADDYENTISGDETYAEKARLAWQSALDKHPNEVAVLINAAHFYLRDNLDKAEELLLKGLALDPQNPVWNHNLGKLYELRMIAESEPQRSVDGKKALDYYEKGLPAKVAEDSMRSVLKVAELSMDLNDPVRATKYANELLAAVPERYSKLDDYLYGDALYRGNCILGELALAKGDIEEAKQYLLTASHASRGICGEPPDFTLAQDLLDKAEKETVITFLKNLKAATHDSDLRKYVDDLLSSFDQGETPRLVNDRVLESVSSPLDYAAVRPVGNFPKEFEFMGYGKGTDNYYPYNEEAYECWLPVGLYVPAGTWIRLSSKEGKTVYALCRGTTLGGCEKKICVDQVALETLGWDFKSQPEMTWQFVKSEDVPPGPWIPTRDDATTYAKRSIESKTFREALGNAMFQSEEGEGDDYALVDKLWAEQPSGVHYCSEIVYALTKDATVDQLNALVAKGAPTAVPGTELTPLMMAIARRNAPAVKWLLDHGEGNDAREFAEALNVGNLEIIQAFLDHGITVKSQKPVALLINGLATWEDSPVHHAVVDLLAKDGLLKPAPGGNPHSLLNVCDKKNTYLLKTLMKLGFNPNSAFTEKSGPLAGKTVVDVIREKADKDESLKPVLDILLGKDN